jgi:hypothetical protein
MNSLRIFDCFRPAFALALFVFWNAIMGLGMFLNGGLGLFKTAAAALAIGMAMLLLAALAMAVLWSGWLRKMALRPGVSLRPEVVTPLMIIALVAALLAAHGFWNAWRLSATG